jgi:thiol-disulfide isomerase/thioredoxin
MGLASRDVAPTALELIEFWATGCGPSERSHEAVSALSDELGNDISVKSYDAWDTCEEVIRHGVVSVPTVILLAGGVERHRWIGRPTTKAQLAAMIAEQLDPAPASLCAAASTSRRRQHRPPPWHHRPSHAH